MTAAQRSRPPSITRSRIATRYLARMAADQPYLAYLISPSHIISRDAPTLQLRSLHMRGRLSEFKLLPAALHSARRPPERGAAYAQAPNTAIASYWVIQHSRIRLAQLHVISGLHWICASNANLAYMLPCGRCPTCIANSYQLRRSIGFALPTRIWYAHAPDATLRPPQYLPYAGQRSGRE